MRKLTWLLIAVFTVACALMFGAMSPAYTKEAETEPRYVDVDVVSTISGENIYYTSRDVTNVTTDGGAPSYFNNQGLPNCCGPIAGTEIVAFYDKYYPNLIKGWDSYYPATGKYQFQVSEYTDPVLFGLYDLMKCNVEDHGVSEADFKSGLQTYFKNQGYNLSYQSATSGGKLNYDTCVSAVNNNKVIVLFTQPGKLYEITEYSGYNTLNEYNVTGNHIMIAFGYVQIKYYNNGVNFRTERFVKVASGIGLVLNAFYKINSDNLDAAYVVNVA